MTKSIFKPQGNDLVGTSEAIKEKLEIESDLIVTSVILGFICTRYYQGQPCRFDFEHPTKEEMKVFSSLDTKEQEALITELKKNYEARYIRDTKARNDALEELAKKGDGYTEYLQKIQNFYLTLDAMSEVLDKQSPGIGDWLKDGQSPFGEEGELITGRKGGERVSPDKRETPLTISKAAMLQNALAEKNTVYQGRGAYTGLVDNPVKADKNLYPTMRVMPNPNERPWLGITDNDNVKINWGIIRAAPKERPDDYYNLDTDPTVGMGPLPNGNEGSQVGYMHGMCTAIIQGENQGPWCTAYEMATGEKTTKMASCFPCATFMYATGYPPSSIHLGRGESWVPPQSGPRLEVVDAANAGSERKVTECDHDLCEKKAGGWHREIHHYMTIGLEAIKKSETYVSPGHYAKISEFENRLTADAGSGNLNTIGGALFLDALTMHAKEEVRIRQTLAPLYSTLSFMVVQIQK